MTDLIPHAFADPGDTAALEQRARRGPRARLGTTAYLLKRGASACLLAFVTVSLNFFLFRLAPGDAADFSRVPGATPETRHAILEQFGLNHSVWDQYIAYFGQLFRGNFGKSFATGQDVTSVLGPATKNTLLLTLSGGIVALIVGVGIGVVCAWRRKGVTDRALMGTSLALYALPGQWIGLMLILIFGGVLPTAGMRDVFAVNQSTWSLNVAKHLILPASAFALTLFGQYAILTRSAVLETLGEDYVLAARAKGLGVGRILRTYILRNAMLPLTTLIALSVGYSVAGTTLIETVFSWPGVGRALYQSVLDRDYPVMEAAFLLITVSVIFFNMVADLLYGMLDPRVRR